MPTTEIDWPPRRILIGFDGSDGAVDAAELCHLIAPADAHVTLIDVLPYPGAYSGMFHLLTEAEYKTPEEYFAPAISRLPGREIGTLTYLGESPAHVFESFAVEQGIDLIVVGSPHRGAVGRVLAGSVGQALLHGSPVPVATAPRGFAQHPTEAISSIAVAYDGRPESRAALAYAQALAKAAAGRLQVLTVERPTEPVGGAIAYTFAIPEDVEDIQRQALDEVDPALELRRRLLNGRTAEALADACRDDVDLLVVGSRGYGTVERVLLGSTSTELIHRAPCPVLVVPRPAKA